uniref:Trafficking protein, kinesin binding 2 n=1 Tax=Xiphophorus couchianus TaxID=32473 RepID=A0A3B5MQ77_9TELE
MCSWFPDEGLGSSGRHYTSSSLGSCSAGSGSLYLSDSQDWVVSPSCSPDETPAQISSISPMLAEETLRYMILSADRVEQMTKTYNDIEVVTHLLAERDRDLELAARIGQSLLQRNHLLQERNDVVEEQLAQAVDQVHQLQHELNKKDELLRIVASASEEGEQDAAVSTPQQQPQLLGGAAAALSQLEQLQNKLQEVEEENQALRSEACQLKKDTMTYEEKEQQLVSDCVKELRESNSQMVSLTDELSQKNEELLRHQEEIAQLLSQIVELQHRVKELALEKEELRIHLQASKDAQRQLTAELNELAERNAECVEMLHESQDEIRELRSRSIGLFRKSYPTQESLAAEIEGSMRRELSIDEETAFQDQRISQKRVFQTVRSVNAAASRAALATPPIPGSGQSSLVMTAQPFQSAQDLDLYLVCRDEVRMGKPGLPGGNDLIKALHRLSLRRQNFLSEHQFFQAEREKKLQNQTGAEAGVEGSGCSSPMGSVLSSFSNLSDLTVGSTVFKTFLPEKLQIVKPMEGSLTLHHWQQLAQPHLATILDPHPGVVTKGFRPLAQDAMFRLSDMEEDEEAEKHREIAALEKGTAEKGFFMSFVLCLVQNPGKSQSSTFSTYTFTTCRILHPTDITQVTPSSQSSLSANTPSSMRTGPSTPVTPCRLSLGDSFPPRRPPAPPCGLAKLVLERGISAQVSTDVPSPLPRSAPRQPLLRIMPSTPPNSPSHSPTPSLVPTEPRQHPSDNFLASRPAELFLQDVYGLNLGRAPHPDLVSLVERLCRLGFTKVLHSSESDTPVPHQESATFVSAGGGSLMDGLRRNQSLPAMIGARAGSKSTGHPPHPTSLAIPPPLWGNLKERRRHLASISHPPRSSKH